MKICLEEDRGCRAHSSRDMLKFCWLGEMESYRQLLVGKYSNYISIYLVRYMESVWCIALASQHFPKEIKVVMRRNGGHIFFVSALQYQGFLASRCFYYLLPCVSPNVLHVPARSHLYSPLSFFLSSLFSHHLF